MASSLALRRATASTLLFNNNLLLLKFNPLLRSASVAHRSFNTDAQVTGDIDRRSDRSVDVSRRSDSSVAARRRDVAPLGLLSDVFDPFSPVRSLSQVLNLMDQLLDNPFAVASRGLGAGTRRGFDVREDNEALYLRLDMPGVDKDKLKIRVEQGTLIITGEAEKESVDDEGRRYSSRIDLPPNLYKVDEIKAELKNGVLKIRVPKVKEEERKDVHEVKVE